MLPENQTAFEQLDVACSFSEAQKDRLRLYIEMIELWSERMNLVSGRDLFYLVTRHLADSVAVARLPQVPEQGRVLDLGSGAGFPGVPLAILKPQLHVTLLDSIGKKARFLQEVVDVVQIENACVLCERAENLRPTDNNERYDVVTARAVARLDKLWRWSKPLLRPGGKLLAQKGGDVQPEIAELTKKARVTVSVQELKARKDDDKKVLCVSPA